MTRPRWDQWFKEPRYSVVDLLIITIVVSVLRAVVSGLGLVA